MIQKILLRMFQSAFKLIETLYPGLAEKWAIGLFFKPRKFKRPQREEELLASARIRKVPFQSNFKLDDHEDYYVRYDWGNGSPAILLVHGWEGRALQMGYFVQPLLNAGYRVITFDAIAHGDSPGKRTNMPEFAKIIKDIDKDMGGFDAIIGHSLGGTAAGYAINEHVRCERLITICSPAAIEFIFDSFAQQINASQKTIEKLTKFLENFTGKQPEDFSFTNIAPQINTPGLIIHDKHDKEIPYEEALALHENWPDSKLILTEDLGHRRILRDKSVISKIVDYIGKYQPKKLLQGSASIQEKTNYC